ncbi:MAG: hypothetical protein COB69_10710 [Phycisphaera sp.]|nr:MAG: hypothetical protein COB69_10710 [Phycisphaera sp.]
MLPVTEVHTMKRWTASVVACLALPVVAQVPPDYGFNFITIGDVGNAAFVGDINDEHQFRGHGSVNYEYRIAKTEIRTSDWVEFANMARRFQIPLDTALGAVHWGAGLAIDPKTGDEVWVQFSKASGDWPVAGTSWWAAATYANWLHNDKAETAEAFLTGAYDISTFERDPTTGLFSDQPTRSPGAKYWIPSVDEWMKAAHYDPTKDGPSQGGWWQYPNGSDTKPVTGIPGVGETNADLFDIIGPDAWHTPVGSYPESQSPWGLLDVSGGASEWTEDWLFPSTPSDRVTDGTSIATGLSPMFDPDLIGQGYIADRPDFRSFKTGLRLASAIPSPAGSICFVVASAAGCIQRKRSI